MFERGSGSFEKSCRQVSLGVRAAILETVRGSYGTTPGPQVPYMLGDLGPLSPSSRALLSGSHSISEYFPR